MLLPASADAGWLFGSNHKTVVIHNHGAPVAAYEAPVVIYRAEAPSYSTRVVTKTKHKHRHGKHTTVTVQQVR
jgi:hypothetical protein